MMSWKWQVRSVRQLAASASAGHCPTPSRPASAASSSASWRMASARRLARFVRAWVVYVPRWYSR